MTCATACVECVKCTCRASRCLARASMYCMWLQNHPDASCEVWYQAPLHVDLSLLSSRHHLPDRGAGHELVFVQWHVHAQSVLMMIPHLPRAGDAQCILALVMTCRSPVSGQSGGDACAGHTQSAAGWCTPAHHARKVGFMLGSTLNALQPQEHAISHHADVY